MTSCPPCPPRADRRSAAAARVAPGELQIRPYDFDEGLIEGVRRDGRPRLRVYGAASEMVVLGRGSRPEVELDLEKCLRDGIDVRRRRGGGCAVWIDRGNVVVSVATVAAGLGQNQRYLAQLTQWMINGLTALGLNGVKRSGICDLVLANRKISGACIYRSRGLLFYSATLLVRPDVSLMMRYLRHPPREPDYREGRSHAEFVTSLAEHIPLSPEAFADRLSAALSPPALR